jgi:hypothetical protein
MKDLCADAADGNRKATDDDRIAAGWYILQCFGGLCADSICARYPQSILRICDNRLSLILYLFLCSVSRCFAQKGDSVPNNRKKSNEFPENFVYMETFLRFFTQ